MVFLLRMGSFAVQNVSVILVSVLLSVCFQQTTSGGHSTYTLTGHGASSFVELSHEQRTHLIRFLTQASFPPGTTFCELNDHCDSRLQRCDTTTKLCVAKDAPEYPLTMPNTTCEDNHECPFLYRCFNNTCEYTFFKACMGKVDCFQELGLEYECREISTQIPGKQCYRKCHLDRDCHDCNGNRCRYPETFRKFVTCCDGYCSRKIACDDYN
ncbi:hypothetical protein RvY_04618 [Ramazzottius varieornatus]|uniref:WAP domain-containing protein n=1 Tax=Ramazzottius varieornatus TaxID=947166 RepID=A0A1D1USV4_RAMVA|nr:hypothetical protein RvY_04618 [Ramazzottius varieornatus]